MKVIPGGHRRRIAKLKNALIYPDQTAAVLLSLGQKILGVIILGLAAAMTAIYGFHLLLVAISTLITMFFVVYVGLMVVFWWLLPVIATLITRCQMSTTRQSRNVPP